ncbi:unnamed protein product [Penicillium nalgiovense]|uniref:Uncharacterized protein n=1 Tax=Penicillium nalgiovense TaxID=60175 RepID=A0A9W4HM92_PENNA|nr:unnamed protein product [Penicillium nalgiovense]CAG7999653.1 unnamed protein product [Penicillium nalgiovense]CAG8000329.1 unnamed protein product [Penicillium nalgiovense]CAG8014817.1 unnamed protein product [Penicillium nalgiovense]CAG8018170.1 unnamed protein product [Penicillium nalgiovense]
MANDPKASRIAERGAAKAKSRAGRSRAGSPFSARSTGSTTKGNRSPLNSVAKLHKGRVCHSHHVISLNDVLLTDHRFQGHSMAKSARKKDHEATHRNCLDLMDQIQKEFELALGAIDEERAHDSQSMQRLHAEMAQETSNLQQAITAKDKALVENQRLVKELCQIQQQQESVKATMQDQVSWHDIQPVLHQAHGDLVSATTRFWNTIDALRNHALASYFPSSGVIHGSWPEQDDPLGTLGHNALPGFSASSDYPVLTQEAPAPSNHESLV